MRKEEQLEFEQEEPVVLDPEADDSEASDILELIERESAESEEVEAPETPAAAQKEKVEDESFALESLYFRSFGERPLLTRDEEVALAKRIDQGTRGVRTALRTRGRVGREETRLESKY